MLVVVNRFRVAEPEAASYAERLLAVRDLLSGKAGYLDGVLGRNLDEPDLWVLQTRWVNVGSYRRALSSYDVKLGAVPLLSQATDEPSAFEVVGADGALGLNDARPRELD